MEMNNNGMKGPLRRSGRVPVTQAQKNAKVAANLASAAASKAATSAAKKAAGANLKGLIGTLGGVGVADEDDDLLAGLLGTSAAAAAPAPAGPSAQLQAMLPIISQAKAEYESAKTALEYITKNNIRENNGTIIQSAVGLSNRAAAEQNLIYKKAAFDEVYQQYLAQGGKPLEGGLRRRRHSTKRSKAKKAKKHTRRHR